MAENPAIEGAPGASKSDTRTRYPDVQAPYPITNAEPNHPTEEAYFGRWYP